MVQGFDTVPEYFPNEIEHRRKLAVGLKGALQGKLNCVNTVTLTPSSTTTTLIDARITPNSFISFQPKTANASAAFSGLYVSAQSIGTATLTHANNAFTDKSFNVLIIG